MGPALNLWIGYRLPLIIHNQIVQGSVFQKIWWTRIRHKQFPRRYDVAHRCVITLLMGGR